MSDLTGYHSVILFLALEAGEMGNCVKLLASGKFKKGKLHPRAMKTQRGSRGIAVLFLEPCHKMGVNS
jgi:hypothetical protein